jgi:hypothetical protein
LSVKSVVKFLPFMKLDLRPESFIALSKSSNYLNIRRNV